MTDGVSPEVIIWTGAPENYATFTFNVPAGVNRLDASLAYPGNGGNDAHLSLIDPLGRYAANSLPQGSSNFANVDVISPTAGIWTGAIYEATRPHGGVNGTIPWQVETEQFVPFGKIKPSSVTLNPGQSKTVTFTATTPKSPGDQAASIVLASGSNSTSVPVTLRSLVPAGIVGSSGKFSGVLTGGNGRPPGEGAVQYYQFNVPLNIKNITANLSLGSDAGDNVSTYLISPDGDARGYGQNDLSGNILSSTAYTLHPVPGLWTFIVDQAGAIAGDQVSVSYSGNILLNNVSVSAPGLPNAKTVHLAAGVPVTYAVNITNNGAAPQQFFIDPRLDTTTDLTLATQFASSDTGLPLPLPYGMYPIWLVPSETSTVSVAQTANLPAMFDFSPVTGDPDLASASSGPGPLCSTTASASYTPPGGSVTSGLWYAFPDECGPYPSGAPAGTASIAMTTTSKAFDPAVTSATGDLWLQATNPSASFTPIQINPGQTVSIDVTITPSGPSGTVVSGALYVDVFVNGLLPYYQIAGDELAVLPYEYKIK